MKNYKGIRSPEQQGRCKKPYSSILYCNCGCQTPRESDPAIDLEGITLGRKPFPESSYVELRKEGKCVGFFSRQYMSIVIGETEFLGVNGAPAEKLKRLYRAMGTAQ